MRIVFRVLIALLVSVAAGSLVASDNSAIIGSWEGESKCTVPDSPCRDEHALYRIGPNKQNASQLNIDAYKIINGTPEFMGTLACQYHADQSTLSCSGNVRKKDDWELRVSGDTMTGTLTIGDEKTLYRRVSLRKSNRRMSSGKGN